MGLGTEIPLQYLKGLRRSLSNLGLLYSDTGRLGGLTLNLGHPVCGRVPGLWPGTESQERTS